MRRPFPMTVLALLATLACGATTTDPDPVGDPDLRVLYVGNSLTATNDLPAVVEALAEAAGRTVAWSEVIRPGVSLEDHWRLGLESEIRDAGAEIVVLQQGPSSTPRNQEHLAHWAGVIAPVVREAGGEPALLMVWPEELRSDVFPDVRASYENAATAVGGLFIPAGQTWVEAWTLDPSLDFYGRDRFHPSYLGTLAAAQTVAAVLLDLDPGEIPALDDGIPAGDRATLRQAIAAALAGTTPGP